MTLTVVVALLCLQEWNDPCRVAISERSAASSNGKAVYEVRIRVVTLQPQLAVANLPVLGQHAVGH
jgi:hypothetical protein